MKRKILSIVLVLALTLSFCSVAFADDGGNGGIETYETDTIIYDISRTSASKADVYIDVYFSQVVDSYNVVVYLQKKVGDSWVIDTTNPERTLYNNGFKKSTFYFHNEYTGLERGVSYRIKCVSKDHIGSSTHTTTTYSRTF